MSEQKNVRVRDEIKQFGQAMERRMRGREPEILAGTLVHLRQMDDAAILQKVRDHCDLLTRMAQGDAGGQNDAADQAADLANYAMEALRRIEAGG